MKMLQNCPTPRTTACTAALALAMLAGHAIAQTATPLAEYPLMGIARDFAPAHSDFDSAGANSLPLSSGNVSATIGSMGVPDFAGAGSAVSTSARDKDGRTIAPCVATGAGSGAPVTDFTISGSDIITDKPVAARIRVIGSAIVSGNYNCAVTTQVHVGSQTYMPFGSFDGAMSGNVNDDKNPRNFVVPGLIAANTPITVDGRSWLRKQSSNPSLNDADWNSYMTINSRQETVQVRALRNGDLAPNVGGFQGQVSAKDMLVGLLDTTTNRMTLNANQVIYLFELGTTSVNSSAFDMQDLVVMVDLATDPSYFNPDEPTDTGCVTIRDQAATFSGANAGGITNSGSFRQWFENAPGQNIAMRSPITMTRDNQGVYAFETNDFDPVRGLLYGTPGEEHNRGFTYAIDAGCTYKQCGRQFFEVIADGDTWAFVNGKLVVDMGGTHAGERQYVDIDRLGLSEGQPIRVQVFTAQRSSSAAGFGFRTNMVLRDTMGVNTPAVNGLFD